jgi:hypothetical protein
MLLQKVWQQGTDWDEQLDPELTKQTTQWNDEL